MTILSREDVISVLGAADDDLIIEILSVGATREELEEAFAWLNADDALARQLHRQPSGRVAELCDILERDWQDDDHG